MKQYQHSRNNFRKKAILAKLGQWETYLTIHTYGNWWFTPWSYTPNLPADYNELVKKAQIGELFYS